MSNTLFKIVLVPAWLDDIVDSANLGPDAYINLDQLLRIFSAEDVVRYTRLQQPEILNTAFPMFADTCVQDMYIPEALYPYLNLMEYDQPTIEHLQNTHCLRDRTPFKSTSYVFELFPIKLNTYGVRLQLRDPELTLQDDIYACCDKSIELLSMSYGLDAIAPLEVFKRFVRVCATTA